MTRESRELAERLAKVAIEGTEKVSADLGAEWSESRSAHDREVYARAKGFADGEISKLKRLIRELKEL